MLKEENAELIIDGKRVENDYTFVADDEEMKVEISYTFNASALGGKNLVTFEELYDLSNPDEPVKVAEHKDIEDNGQTVLITERIITIHTTATDKDGNKEIEAGKEVTIIDTVTLEGLEVGTQYKLVGWQMLKKKKKMQSFLSMENVWKVITLLLLTAKLWKWKLLLRLTLLLLTANSL